MEAGWEEGRREPQREPWARYNSSRHSSRGDFGLQCTCLTPQRPGGTDQHSGLSGVCTLWLNPVTGVDIQMYGRWDLAGAITRKRAMLQRSESASYLPLPIAVKPGRSSKALLAAFGYMRVHQYLTGPELQHQSLPPRGGALRMRQSSYRGDVHLLGK